MKVLAFNGSPRRRGNTTLLLSELLRGAREAGAETEDIRADDIKLHACRGCLRCNVLKRCSLKGDDWEYLSDKIVQADALVFASPVYFHHVPAPLKKIIDRFRSFIQVMITEDALRHTPWREWMKQFVLLLCMGSSDEADARPVIELFEYITGILGPDNTLDVLLGKRLAVTRQVIMDTAELQNLYKRYGLPEQLAVQDAVSHELLIKRCYDAGRNLVASNAGK